MSRKQRKTVIQQINERFNEITRYGVKRQDLKAYGSADRFITSVNTRKCYQREITKFCQWCLKEYDIKKVDQMVDYAPLYMNKLIKEQKSPRTQKTVAAAMNKFYGDNLGLKTQSFSRSQITRSRYPVKSLSHFSEDNNKDLVEFCRHTGLRRSELIKSTYNPRTQDVTLKDCQKYNIKGISLIEKEGQYYIHNVVGKGGKHRDVLILDNYSPVIERIRGLKVNEPLFEKVHSKAPIHSYRADYGCSLYQHIEPQLNIDEEYISPFDNKKKKRDYICRTDKAGEVYNRLALEIVSQNLGHNRESEPPASYLYKIS